MPIVVWTRSHVIFAAVLTEEVSYILMASHRRPMEWRRTISGLRIYVGTILQEQLSRVLASFGGGNVERCVAAVGCGVYIGVACQKQSGYVCITTLRCSVQGGYAFIVPGVRVGVIGKQKPHDVCMAPACRPIQRGATRLVARGDQLRVIVEKTLNFRKVPIPRRSADRWADWHVLSTGGEADKGNDE
jgi:hypothetical protein